MHGKLIFVLSLVFPVMLTRNHAIAAPPDPLGDARKLMREQKYDDAAPVIQAFLKQNRFDGEAWSTYAICLHGQKQYEESIEAGKRAIELGPVPSAEMYNIACVYALMGKPDDALAWLGKSLDAGFAEQDTLETDDEMNSVRNDPRFIELTGLNPPPEESAAKRWAYDLEFLVRRMEQMHWRAHEHVSKSAFRAEIEQLKLDLPNCNLERAKVKLSKLIALVGDGHTVINAFAKDESEVQRIPLHTRVFADGLYVIGAQESQRELLGAKVLKIGATPADDALKRVRGYCSVDNEMGYLATSPGKLNNVALLAEIGAVKSDATDVSYTLRLSNGSTREVTLATAPVRKDTKHNGPLRADLTYANASSDKPVPLYLEHAAEPLWFRMLDDQKTMYFGFHAIAENPNERFDEFVAELFKSIDEKHAEYLVIDMRHNGGGNTGLVLPLLHALIKNDRINRPGHLFVIIGRDTFSAAQNTVNLVELHTNATFVGEPTGSRPNFVGEGTYFILPYSKIRITCSSRYWQHVVSTDKRPWVQPQIAAEMSFDDFAQNRDTCMDAILARIRNRK